MSISIQNLTPLNASQLKFTKASSEQTANMRDMQAKLHIKPDISPESNYAEVKANGKVIATITNSGFVQSSNTLGGEIRAILNDDNSQGPVLAERRASQLANAFGGEIVHSSTAQTQAQWEARPSIKWSIDADALRKNGYDVPEAIQKKPFSSQALATETIAALLSATESPSRSPSPAISAETNAEIAVPDSAAGRKAEFQEWKTEYFTKSIGQDRRQQVKDYSDGFELLLDKASTENAYNNPLSFVDSLTSSELDILQKIHGLANPITPSVLSEEGALNLLLSPGHAQDTDNDGFQMVGIAKTWQFPPVNAPESVKKAWKDTTADMNEKDVMMLQASFLPRAIEIEGYTKTNKAYINPDADYATIIQKALDGAEFGKKFDKSWQSKTRERQIAGLSELLSKLTSNSTEELTA